MMAVRASHGLHTPLVPKSGSVRNSLRLTADASFSDFGTSDVSPSTGTTSNTTATAQATASATATATSNATATVATRNVNVNRRYAEKANGPAGHRLINMAHPASQA